MFSAQKPEPDSLKNKQVLFVLAAALLLGFLLRFINLSGARFFFTDEYHTMAWGGSGRYPYWCSSARYPFLSAGYKIPLLVWGKFEDVVMYTSAAWGMVNILLIFAAGSILFNYKVGSYAAFFLSLFAVHVSYSRSGFPPVFQSIWLLSAFVCFSLYFKNNSQKPTYLVLTGIFSSLAFFTHTSSYSAIAAFFILTFFLSKLQKQTLAAAGRRTIIIIGSFILIIAAFEFFKRFVHHESFFSKMAVYGKQQHSWLFDHHNNPRPWLRFSRPLVFFKKIVSSGGYFQAELIIFGYFYGVVEWFKNRDKGLLLVLGFITLSFFIISLMGSPLFAVHMISPRYYLHVIPFVCICLAVGLHKIELSGNYKKPVAACLLIFTFLSVPESIKVIQGAFKVEPINIWLKQHDIDKNKIATLLNLDERNYPRKTKSLPNIGLVKLNWKRIRRLYDKNKIEYILTSGIGAACELGKGDPVLKKHKPLKVWIHPYHKPNSWRHTSLRYTEMDSYPRIGDFALYALERIFSAEQTDGI